jgi:glutaredoxin 3
VAVEYLDVEENPKLLPGMLKHSGGQRRVPVIVEDGKVTIGFGGS